MNNLDNINSKLYVTLEINKMFDNRIVELNKLYDTYNKENKDIILNHEKLNRIEELNYLRKNINLILEDELT